MQQIQQIGLNNRHMQETIRKCNVIVRPLSSVYGMHERSRECYPQ